MPLLIFCLIMLVCLILNISVIYALAAGLVLFLLYGKSKGFSWTELIYLSAFLLMTFLLNSAVSVLTGTSFGTSATMGVICASIGMALGVDMRITGGDPCSGDHSHVLTAL